MRQTVFTYSSCSPLDTNLIQMLSITASANDDAIRSISCASHADAILQVAAREQISLKRWALSPIILAAE